MNGVKKREIVDKQSNLNAQSQITSFFGGKNYFYQFFITKKVIKLNLLLTVKCSVIDAFATRSEYSLLKIKINFL